MVHRVLTSFLIFVRRLPLPAIALFLLFGGALFVETAWRDHRASLHRWSAGDTLPSLPLFDRWGHVKSGVLEVYRGPLFFFSPSCDHCVRELKVWNALIAKGALSQHFVAVSVGTTEETERILELYNIRWEVLYAGADRLRERWQVRTVPVMFAVDRRVIRRVQFGEVGEKELFLGSRSEAAGGRLHE